LKVAVAPAGYYIARAVVTPTRMVEVSNPINAILEREIELRFVRDLWPLRDDVVESSLEFSIIRMKNAKARAVEGGGV
jgi:hypothetical protein